MQTNASLAFLLPLFGSYCLPRKLRQASWAGLEPPELRAFVALLCTCAVYSVELLLLRYLLSATASLQVLLLADKSAPQIRCLRVCSLNRLCMYW